MANWGPRQYEDNAWEGDGIDTVYPFTIGSGGLISDQAPSVPHAIVSSGENVIGEDSKSARGLIDSSQATLYDDASSNLATDPFYSAGSIFKAVSAAGVHEVSASTSGVTARLRVRFNPQKDQAGTNPEWDDPDGFIVTHTQAAGDDNVELMLDVTQDYRAHGDVNTGNATYVNYEGRPDISAAHHNHSIVWPIRVRSDRSVSPNPGKFAGPGGSTAADFKVLCEARIFKATDSNGVTQYCLYLVWYKDKDDADDLEVFSSDYILLAAVHEATGVSPANMVSPFFTTDAGAPVVMTPYEVEVTFVATLLGGCTLTATRMSDGYRESISITGQPTQFGGGQDGGTPIGIQYVDVGCSWASATSYGSFVSGLYPNEGPRQLLTWSMDEVSGEDVTTGVVGGGDSFVNINTMNFYTAPMTAAVRTLKMPWSGSGGKPIMALQDTAAMTVPDEDSDRTVDQGFNFWAEEVDTLKQFRTDIYARQGEPPVLADLRRDIVGIDDSGGSSTHWTTTLRETLIEVDHSQNTGGVIVGTIDNTARDLYPSPNWASPDTGHTTKFGFAFNGSVPGNETCKIRFAAGIDVTADMNYPNDSWVDGAAETNYMWWIRVPSFLLLTSATSGVRKQQFEIALFTDGDRPTDPGVSAGLGTPPKGVGIRFRPGGPGVIAELFVQGTTSSDTIHAIVGLEAADESYFVDAYISSHDDDGSDVEFRVHCNGRSFFTDAAGTGYYTVSKAEIDTIEDAVGGEKTRGMGYSAAGYTSAETPFMGPRYSPMGWGGGAAPWQGFFHKRVDRAKTDYADTDALSAKLYHEHDFISHRSSTFSEIAYLKSRAARCQWKVGDEVSTARREPFVCYSLVEEKWDAEGSFSAPFPEVDGINPIQGFFGFPTYDDHHAISGIETNFRAAYRGLTFYGDGEDWVDMETLSGTPAFGTSLTIDTPYIPKGISLLVWGNPSDRRLASEATDVKVQILCIDPAGALVASSAIFTLSIAGTTAEEHHLRVELIEIKLDSGGRELRANIYAQDPGASTPYSFNNVPILQITGTDAVTLSAAEWATFTTKEVLIWRYFSHDGALATTKVQTTWLTGGQLFTSGTLGGGGGQRDYSTVMGVAPGLQEKSVVDVRGTMETVPYKRIVDVVGRVEGAIDDPQLGFKPINRRLLVFEPDTDGRMPGSVGHVHGLGNTTANWYYVGVKIDDEGPIFWGAPATAYDDDDLTAHKLEPLQITYESGSAPTMTLEQRSIAHFGGHLRAGMHVVYLEQVNGQPFEIEGNTGAVVGGGGVQVLFRGVVTSVSRRSEEAKVVYECIGMQGVLENETLLGMTDCGIGQIAFNVEPGSPNIPYAISRMLDYNSTGHGTPDNHGSMFGLGTPDLTGMTLADIIEFLINLFRVELNELGALRLRSDGKVTVANADGSTVVFHPDNDGYDDDENTDDGHDEDNDVDIYFSYENGTGTFIPGNTITGATSGATGVVVTNTTHNADVGVLGVKEVTGGPFDDTNGEEIDNGAGVTADIVVDSIGEVVAHQGPAETASIVWSPNREAFNLRPVETVVKGSFSGIIRSLLENLPDVRWRLEPARLRWVFETRASLKGVTIFVNQPGTLYDLADDASEVSTAALFASPWRKQTQFWASWKDGTIKPYWMNGLDMEWMSTFAQIGSLEGEVVEAHNWPYGPNAGPDSPQNTLITIKVNVGDEQLPIGNFDKTTFKVLEGQHAGFTSTVSQSQQQGGFTPPFQYFVFTVAPPLPGSWDTDVELVPGDLVQITDDPLEGTTNDSAAYSKVWADYILIEPGTGTPVSNILPGGHFLANSPVGGCGGTFEDGVQQNIPVNSAVQNGQVVTSAIPLVFGAFACSVDPLGTGHAITCGGEIIYRAIRVQEGVWCARAPDVGFAGTAYQDVITHEGVVSKAHADGLGFDDVLAHWPIGQWEPRGGSLAKLLIVGGHAVIFDTDDIEPAGVGTETDLNANVSVPFVGGWELANDWTASPAFAGTPQQTKPLIERTLDDGVTDIAEWDKQASGSAWETSQGIAWKDVLGDQGRCRGAVLTRFIPSNYGGPQDFTIITAAGHFQTSSLNAHQEIEAIVTVDLTNGVTSLAQVGLIARAENGWVEQHRVPPNDEGASDPWFLAGGFSWTNEAGGTPAAQAHLASYAYRNQTYITYNKAAMADSIPGWISSDASRNNFREGATPDTGGGDYDGLNVLGSDGRVIDARYWAQDPTDISATYKTNSTDWPTAARKLKSGLEFGTTGYVFRMVRGDEPDNIVSGGADATSLWPTLFWYHTRRAVNSSGNQVYDINNEPVYEGVKEILMQWPAPIGVAQLDDGEDIRLKMSFDQGVNGGPIRIRCAVEGLAETGGYLNGQWHNERSHDAKYLLFDGTVEHYGSIPFGGQYNNLYSGFSMAEGAHGFGCGIVKAVMTKADGSGDYEDTVQAAKTTRFLVRRINQPEFEFHEFQEELDAAFDDAQVGLVTRSDRNSIRYSLIDTVGPGSTPRVGDHYRLYMDRGWRVARMKTFEADGLDDPAKVWIFKHMADSALKSAQDRKYAGSVTVPGTRYDLSDGGIGLNLASTDGYTGLEDVRQPLAGVTYQFPASESRSRMTICTLETSFNPFNKIDTLLAAQARKESIFGGPAWASPDGQLNTLNQTKQASAGVNTTGLAGFGTGNVNQVCSSNVYIGGDQGFSNENLTLNEWIALFETWVMQIKILIESNKEDEEQLNSDGGGAGGGLTTQAGFIGKDSIYDRIRMRMRTEGRPTMDALVDPKLVYRDTDGLLYAPYLASTGRGDGASFTWVPVVESATPGEFEVDTPNIGRKPREAGTAINRTLIDGGSASYVLTSQFREPIISMVAGTGFSGIAPSGLGSGEIAQLMVSSVGLTPVPDINNTSTNNLVSWATVEKNAGSFAVDLATNPSRIPALKTGPHNLTVNVTYLNSLTDYTGILKVRKNGSTTYNVRGRGGYVKGSGGADSSGLSLVDFPVDLTAGDYLEVLIDRGASAAGPMWLQVSECYAKLEFKGLELAVGTTPSEGDVLDSTNVAGLKITYNPLDPFEVTISADATFGPATLLLSS